MDVQLLELQEALFQFLGSFAILEMSQPVLPGEVVR